MAHARLPNGALDLLLSPLSKHFNKTHREHVSSLAGSYSLGILRTKFEFICENSTRTRRVWPIGKRYPWTFTLFALVATDLCSRHVRHVET